MAERYRYLGYRRTSDEVLNNKARNLLKGNGAVFLRNSETGERIVIDRGLQDRLWVTCIDPKEIYSFLFDSNGRVERIARLDQESGQITDVIVGRILHTQLRTFAPIRKLREALGRATKMDKSFYVMLRI